MGSLFAVLNGTQYRHKNIYTVIVAAFLVFVVLAGLFFPSVFCNCASAAGFPDLQNHWAAAEILAAAEAGYIKGYPDGAFRPGKEITRAEFATIINNYFGFKSPENFADFKDVAGKDWYFTEVGKATAAGYFQGYPEGVFYPAAAITRQEVAGVLGKILAIEETAGAKVVAAGGDLSFADAGRIGAWARPAVAGLVSQGLFAGYPDGSFRPQQAVTRAEAAVLITKVGNYLQDKVKNSSPYLKVEGDIVNIRSGPSQGFGVLGKVKEQEVLEAESFCNGWYRVSYSDYQAGWIAGWLVQEYAAPPQQDKPSVNLDEPDNPGNPDAPGNPVTPDEPNNPDGRDNVEDPGEEGTLKVEVLHGKDVLKVCLLAGPDTEYSWEEKQEFNRLQVFVPGVDSLKSAFNLIVERSGLERIVSRLSDDQAVVEFEFADFPLPVEYNVEEKGPGRLEVIVPHQLLALDIKETEELITVHLQATAPLECEAFRLRNPLRIVMDFPNLQLHSGLAGWEKDFDLPFLQNLRLGQFSTDVVRMVADLSATAFYEIIPWAKNNTLTLELQKATVQGKQVCLDPGHGGRDPGAIGPAGLQEKDVNLAIALQTAELLRAAGMEVIMTREEDCYVDLPSRSAVANNSGAAIFVSIHANAALNNPSAGGTSTYTSSGQQKEERTYLSGLLQEELVAALGLRDMGVFNENFAVLRNTQMPAALVEVAFISNPKEEQLLAGKDFQRWAAEAITQAIKRYFME